MNFDPTVGPLMAHAHIMDPRTGWPVEGTAGVTVLAPSAKEMRIVALIDGRAVIERILCHLGLWPHGVRTGPSGTGCPPSPWI